jgi:hypothetical protein
MYVFISVYVFDVLVFASLSCFGILSYTIHYCTTLYRKDISFQQTKEIIGRKRNFIGYFCKSLSIVYLFNFKERKMFEKKKTTHG